MKDRKINLDRPQLTETEIMAGKNFEAIVQSHQFMSKPFYKQTWFFGTTGLASIGLIIGSTLAFQNNPEASETAAQNYTTDAPPNLTVQTSQLIVLNSESKANFDDLAKTTIQFKHQKEPTIAETSTPQKEKINPQKNPFETTKVETEASNQQVTVPTIQERATPTVQVVQEEIKRNPATDMFPRISDKIGGNITRNELLDNKGITTEGDVSVIHFELHLIDGLGGKVFSEDGNQLNQEMRDALNNVAPGETIYFENIRGKVKNGTEVRLNPLRYVLMN